MQLDLHKEVGLALREPVRPVWVSLRGFQKLRAAFAKGSTVWKMVRGYAYFNSDVT